MKKRDYGDGGIEPRGPNIFRLRYRLNGKRFSKTVKGTKEEAKKQLRAILKAADDGQHVAPDKVTFSQWMDQWLDLKAANRRRKTVQRYREILQLHVVPTLGGRPVQQIETREINSLYVNLDPDLSARSKHHVHVVLKSCLKGAVKSKLIIANPVDDAEAPAAESSNTNDDDEALDAEIGQALDADELAKLVRGLKGATIYEIVAVAAFTGMRRGEILGLRWSDLDVVTKTLKISRAVEYVRKHGLAFKPPKTKRGRRTITIDDSLIELLLQIRKAAADHRRRPGRRRHRSVIGKANKGLADVSRP
jgi:integrase